MDTLLQILCHHFIFVLSPLSKHFKFVLYHNEISIVSRVNFEIRIVSKLLTIEALSEYYSKQHATFTEMTHMTRLIKEIFHYFQALHKTSDKSLVEFFYI